MHDDEEDPITIDHLVDAPCVFNLAVILTVRKRNGILQLASGNDPGIKIDEVLSMCEDGGYMIKVSSQRSSFAPFEAHIISQAVFSKQVQVGQC